MPTRDEIYTAIRNADAAGDSAGVRKLGAYLQTLPEDAATPSASPAAVSAPKPFDRAAFMAQEEAQNTANQADNLRQFGKDVFKSAGDTALSLGSQVILAPVAGLAGAAAAPFVGMDRAADVVSNVSGFGYTPKSHAGQQTAQVIGQTLEKANAPGEYVAEKTGSPALGAAVTTGIQGSIAMLDPAARGAFSSVAKGATAAGRAAARGGAAATESQATAAAAATAEKYAASNGLDWNSLSDAIREKLTTIAKSAGALDGLDPAALARQAKFESLPVPVRATRGVLDRDAAQMRSEANVNETKAGAPIKERQLETNSDLLANLDHLKGKVTGKGNTAATATTPEQAGGAIQGAARAKQAFAKAKTKAAYDVAGASPEAGMKVDPEPLRQFLDDPINAKDTNPLMTLLRAYVPEDGGGITATTLQRIRQKISPNTTSADGTVRHTAGQALEIIDKMAEGSGGELYAKARAAHKAERTEFGDQAAVSDLVENNSRTDRTTALSGTVKAVTSGAPEQIRQIKQTLLTGGDEATRTAGRQAWREVRSQVLQQIKEDATKSLATTADGTPILTPGGLNSAIKKFGPQKLDEIFGPGTTKQLYKILEVAKDSKVIPEAGGANVGSSTVKNALAFLEKGLTKTVGMVPAIGKPVAGLLDAGIEQMAAKSAAQKATATTPIGEALKGATKDAAKKTRQQELKKVPLSSLAIGAQAQ